MRREIQLSGGLSGNSTPFFFLRLPHGAYDFLLAPEGRFLQGRLLLHPQEQYFRLWEAAAALV